MTDFVPFPYQERVANLVLGGKSVILKAPTGAGKTAAALLPFIHAIQYVQPSKFPRQCIYSVPMRVLANQFKAEYADLARRSGLTDRLKVEIQTGDHPDDPRINGDLVFTTIDQTLSNLLCVPYAVGGGSANINAGAVLSSYLVFDEFHLLSPDDSLKTTLELLAMLSDPIPVTPFVLMTATFTSKMLEVLARKLNAQVVTVSRDELMNIPSQQNKVRNYDVCEKQLRADDVLSRHRTRSIAICNTVERAQLLYEALAAKVRGTETSVMLLHARFTSKHRAEKEQTIRAEFGSKKKNWSNPSLILVATQVIEVGLDITCENLHTEIAPASAVLQRAGRCARFKDERGDVFIYDVPLDKNGNRSFAPYGGKVERYLCEKAWDVFRKRLAQSLDFYGEQEVIDEVHTETDTRMLDELEESKGQTWDQIRHAITQCDPSMRPQLIRDASDTCTLLVCDDPESLGNPYGYRGFSFHRGSLLGKWNDLREWARARELEWVIRYPSEIAESQQSEDAKQALEFEWPAVPLHMELRNYMYPIYLVNPALVAYDEGTGFRFSESGGVVSDDLLERAKGPKHGFDSKYRLEGYPGHVQKMIRLHREGQAARLIYAATQLEKRLGLPSCGVDRATRLAIAFHDVGKMQVDWQMWARNYEAAIGERDQVSDPNVMIAHTHSETEEHRQKERKVRPKRPHHAAEGAVATKNLAKMLVGETGALYKAVVTAIARHHSPHTDSFDERYRMHSAAPLAVVLALKEVGENVDAAIVAREFELTAPDINFDEEVLGNDDPAESWLIYLLVVRALRLADGESLGGDVV